MTQTRKGGADMRPPFEYSIQEAAERLGLPIHTLRRWHEHGILIARRT